MTPGRRLFHFMSDARKVAEGGKLSEEQWITAGDLFLAEYRAEIIAELKPKRRKPGDPPRPKAPDPQKDLKNALALLSGTKDLKQVTRNAWKAIGLSLRDIKEVCPDLSVAELERRHQAMLRRYEWYRKTPTPTALAKYWGEFGGDHTRPGRQDVYVEPDRIWRKIALRLFGEILDWETVAWRDVSITIRPDILKAIPFQEGAA